MNHLMKVFDMRIAELATFFCVSLITEKLGAAKRDWKMAAADYASSGAVLMGGDLVHGQRERVY